jgi:hypothetical protein
MKNISIFETGKNHVKMFLLRAMVQEQASPKATFRVVQAQTEVIQWRGD